MAEEEAIEPVVFDAEDGVLNDSDVEPATASEHGEEGAALRGLIDLAQTLCNRRDDDPKVRQLVAELRPLLKDAVKPVIFCRFIATAEALGEKLRTIFPKHQIAVVTGTMAPDEIGRASCRERVCH